MERTVKLLVTLLTMSSLVGSCNGTPAPTGYTAALQRINHSISLRVFIEK